MNFYQKIEKLYLIFNNNWPCRSQTALVHLGQIFYHVTRGQKFPPGQFLIDNKFPRIRAYLEDWGCLRGKFPTSIDYKSSVRNVQFFHEVYFTKSKLAAFSSILETLFFQAFQKMMQKWRFLEIYA